MKRRLLLALLPGLFAGVAFGGVLDSSTGTGAGSYDASGSTVTTPPAGGPPEHHGSGVTVRISRPFWVAEMPGSSHGGWFRRVRISGEYDGAPFASGTAMVIPADDRFATFVVEDTVHRVLDVEVSTNPLIPPGQGCGSVTNASAGVLVPLRVDAH